MSLNDNLCQIYFWEMTRSEDKKEMTFYQEGTLISTTHFKGFEPV